MRNGWGWFCGAQVQVVWWNGYRTQQVHPSQHCCHPQGEHPVSMATRWLSCPTLILLNFSDFLFCTFSASLSLHWVASILSFFYCFLCHPAVIPPLIFLHNGWDGAKSVLSSHHFSLWSTLTSLLSISCLWELGFDAGKENGPKSVNDMKLINAGKILENTKTLAESRVPVGELPGCVITMHVVVRPPTSEKASGNQLPISVSWP